MRRRRARALLPVIAAAAIAARLVAPPACWAAATPGTTAVFPDPAAGQRLVFEKGCTNCHGIAGPGGRQGPDLLRTARGKGSAELLADMWNHVPQMVGSLLAGERLPSLSAGELRDLVGYFSFVNYLGDPGDAARGGALLAEMRCLGCHDLDRRGKIGPALIVPGRSASPVGLVTGVWNHYPNMSAALSDKGIAWFAWSGDIVTDVARYINTLPPAGNPPPLAPGDPAAGARVFERLGCSGCHTPARGAEWLDFAQAANRRSAAENGAALLRHLPRLGESARRTGARLRPLSESEMADLLAYLSMAGTDLAGGDPSRGRAVFESKRCSDCHAAPGGRSGIGPDVADMPALQNPYEAAALMLQHARNMKVATELKHVPWPQMQAGELQDLYAFLSRAHRR